MGATAPTRPGWAAAKQRNHQCRGQSKQHQLRAHTGPAAFGDQVSPTGGKAEGTVVKRHAERDTNGEQHHQKRRGLKPYQTAQHDHADQRQADDETIHLEGGLSRSLSSA